MIKSTSILKRILVVFVCVVMLVFSFFGVTNNASAASITRYVATSGTDAGNCSSAASPCRTIQYAVNQSATGDVIKVAAATYTYNPSNNNCPWAITSAVVCFVDKALTILGGFTTSNWSTADPQNHVTILDGQNTVRGVIVVKFNAGATAGLTMEGFTIQNGLSQGANTSNDYNARGFGGGLWSQGAQLTIRHMIFKNNRAIGGSRGDPFGGESSGGGLAIEAATNANLPVVLDDIVFQNNQALGGTGAERGGIAHGGGIFAYNAALTAANTILDNNLAQGGNSTGDGVVNISADALGGGIALQIGASANLARITLTNNQAIGGNAGTGSGYQGGSGLGGAIYTEQAAMQLSDSVVRGNTAQGGVAKNGGLAFGGAININYTDVTVDRSQIVDNLALSGGSSSGGSAGLVSGGGIYMASYASPGSGHLTLTNTVIADNGVQVGTPGTTSLSAGAGMTIQAVTADIVHSTFNNNRFITGGQAGQAISVEGSGGPAGVAGVANLSYTIISNHVNSVYPNGTSALTVYGSSRANLNYVLFSGNSNNTNANNMPVAHGVINQTNTMTPGGSIGFVSPGSPNHDYHLQSNSVARDQATGSTTFVDMDGQARPYNGVSDVGADEYWPTTQVLDAVTTGVFRPGNGLLYLKNSNTTGFADVAINYGTPGDYPVVGDWDGNGTATIGVYRNGSFYLRNSNTVGFADLVFAFGVPGDQPIAGDWDGDGVDTIGVYRPWTGQFLLRNGNSAGTADLSFYLGNVGDVGIAGDWNGDGRDTTGVFRPSNGIIFLKNDNTTGFADVALNYGIPGDKPVTGDWNSDGTDTIGVYRNGIFYLRNSNTVGFADLVFGLGIPGDMPIAGNWDAKP